MTNVQQRPIPLFTWFDRYFSSCKLFCFSTWRFENDDSMSSLQSFAVLIRRLFCAPWFHEIFFFFQIFWLLFWVFNAKLRKTDLNFLARVLRILKLHWLLLTKQLPDYWIQRKLMQNSNLVSNLWFTGVHRCMQFWRAGTKQLLLARVRAVRACVKWLHGILELGRWLVITNRGFVN